MSVQTAPSSTGRFVRCIEASKRVRWEIDADVIRGRRFDLSQAQAALATLN